MPAGADPKLALLEEPLYGDRIRGLTPTQDLHGGGAALRVVGPEDQGGATFSHVFP